jgi:predicted phosphodiesterase
MDRLEYIKHDSETDFEYALRILRSKANSTYDMDNSEIMELLFNQKLSSDEARKRVYGSVALTQLHDNQFKDKTRILHVSDQHCPFNLPKEELRQYRGMVDILVLNGDDEDCQSISKFRKKYRIPFVDEMEQTRKMHIDTINYLEPKQVVFNKGNHNIRLINYFSERIHEDLLSLMPETNLDFIVDMGFYKHDHMNKTKTYFEPLSKVYDGTEISVAYTKEWFCRINNTIFAHPSAYKNGILSTTEKNYLYFLQKGERPFDALVVAHTHSSGLSRYKNTYLIEGGCFCEEPDYALDGKLMKPQSQGFAYIVQDKDGRFIYSDSKLIML